MILIKTKRFACVECGESVQCFLLPGLERSEFLFEAHECSRFLEVLERLEEMDPDWFRDLYPQQFLPLAMVSQNLWYHVRMGREESLRLVSRSQAGDRSAEAKLVELYRGFINRHTRGKPPRFLSWEDLNQVAVIGFLHAVRTFDPGMGLSLLTHAGWHIKKEVRGLIEGNYYAVRIPRYVYGLLADMKRDLGDGLVKSPEDWARQSKRKVSTVMSAWESCQPARSASASIDRSRNPDSLIGEYWNPTVLDRVPSSDPCPEESFLHEELRSAVDTVFGQMPEWRAACIRQHFGLDGDEPKTLRSIGREYGVSKEAVRKQEVRGLRDLRSALLEYLGDSDHRDLF